MYTRNAVPDFRTTLPRSQHLASSLFLLALALTTSSGVAQTTKAPPAAANSKSADAPEIEPANAGSASVAVNPTTTPSEPQPTAGTPPRPEAFEDQPDGERAPSSDRNTETVVGAVATRPIPPDPSAFTRTDTAAPASQQPQSKASSKESKGGAKLPSPARVERIEVTVEGERAARYRSSAASLGPLGNRSILDTPFSIQVVPASLILDQDLRTTNDLLLTLPSAQIEARGSLDYGRPQTRGFESDVSDNVKLDGFSAMAPTAQPVEMYDHLEVLYGPASALYGVGSAAGQFNAVLKRPTAQPLRRFYLGFNNISTFTAHVDLGGRVGPKDMFGYRGNLVASEGTGYVSTNQTSRRLVSLALDARLSKSTVLDGLVSGYVLDQKGLPAGLTYGSSGNTSLPETPDPTKEGLGQPFAGIRGMSNFYEVRIHHNFDSSWKLTTGAARQDTSRKFRSLSLTLTDNQGSYRAAARESADRQELSSYHLYLNGRLESSHFWHELNLGVNGHYMRGYAGRRSTTFNLGAASLDTPRLWDEPTWSGTGPNYHSNSTHTESIIAGYQATFEQKLSATLVGSVNWIHSESFANPSTTPSGGGAPGAGAGGNTQYSKNAALAPSIALSYKPLPNTSLYSNYGTSIQQGVTAPVSAENSRVTLPPIRSEQYELGVKVAFRSLDMTLAGFRIERPFAFVDPADNVFKTEGQQVNYGAELNLSGRLTRDLLLFGGVTLLDPRLKGTGNPATSNKLVVGVPHWQGNLLVVYELPLPVTLNVDMSLHLVDVRAANNTNTSLVRDYVTIDTGLRQSIQIKESRLVLRCGVKNLLNERYWTSLFPGSINGDAASYTAFIGEPRTYEASVRLDL